MIMLVLMLMRTLKPLSLILLVAVLAGCQGPEAAVALTPTAPLAPLVTLTPMVTATPVRTQTPLPTFTFTPSITPIPPTPTISPTPTEVPPITGIIQSLQSVNVREGPGLNYREFVALNPGTGVIVLGRTEDGNWLNVRLEDGREGWVRATLVRVQPSPTPFVVAQLEATVDLTALALGTEFPTSVFGGGTVTPTPPQSAVTATPPTPITPTVIIESSNTPDLPIVAPTNATSTTGPTINTTVIAETAAALASAAATFTPTPGEPLPGTTGTPGDFAPSTNAPTLPAGTAGVQNGVDVLAYCDDRSFGAPAPTNLAAGSSIDVFWSWFAKTEAQVRDHLDKATYDVRLDGQTLKNWQNYRTSIRSESDGNYHVYWFVPSGALSAGEHVITYRVSWSEQITDGYNNFGPGTSRPFEQGTCTFTVR